jgi:hypothetical protein
LHDIGSGSDSAAMHWSTVSTGTGASALEALIPRAIKEAMMSFVMRDS